MNLAPRLLENAFVRLAPLEEAHREPLRPLAADPNLWRFWPRAMAPSTWDRQFDWQCAEHAAGRWIIHAVMTPSGRFLGQSCYLNLRPANLGVEIGGTWYAASAQGGAINPASKLLLLENAFAAGVERVELKTDSHNARSRAAIEKLGATFEGVFRRHIVRPDGTWRDTAWYSILREEWPPLRARLEARLAAFASAEAGAQQ